MNRPEKRCSESMCAFLFIKDMEEHYGKYADGEMRTAVSDYIYEISHSRVSFQFLREDIYLTHDEKLGPPTREQIKAAPKKAEQFRKTFV